MYIDRLDSREGRDGSGRTENETVIEPRKSRLRAVRLHHTISWMFTTTVFRGSQQNLRLFVPESCATRRAYALSRFPQRSPGVGRRRQHVDKGGHLNSTLQFKPAREDVPHENQPSLETSPLWQESARSIGGDPAEGLRHLLMTRESLVVTRLAFSTPAIERDAL